MPIVADASIAIRGDMSGFHRDLQGAERETKSLGGKLKDALSPRNIIGAAGALGLVLGVRQMLSVAGDAAAAYSELQQTSRTVDAIFGDSADVIEDWADRAAKAAGLSKTEVNQAASVMGQTLLNMGFNADEAANKVVQLQQRAADLALAFGKDPQDAILAITAAMRGERDTIEKFGVSIKQADVNSRVLALGLDVSTAAAKKNSEAIAILDIILDQSASSAGRFANSQDDVAVKLAQSQAKIDNFMAESFGPMVASIQLGAIQVTEGVEGAAESIGDFIEQANDPRVDELARQWGLSFEQAQAQIRLGMRETGQDFETTISGMLTSTYELQAAAFNTYASISTAAAEGMASAAAVTAARAGEIANAIPQAVLDNWADIRQAGVDTQLAYNAGIFDTQGAFLTEIDNLLQALDDNLAPGEEIAELRGKKIELMLARGIAEEKGDLGAVAAIDAMIGDINSRLATLNGYSYGSNLAETLAAGLRDEAARRAVQNNAYALGTLIRDGVGIQSEPRDPNSPLRGITQWGGNIVKTIAGGIFDNLGTGSDAAMALAGALVPSVSASGFAGAGVATSVTGDTYILNVDGVPESIGTAQQAIERLEKIGSSWG